MANATALIRHQGYARVLIAAVAACVFLIASHAQAQIKPFVGKYSGSAELVMSDGEVRGRDLSVVIEETRKGFSVTWATITFKPDGRVDVKSYDIDFVPGPREGLYAAAQKKDLFGKDVQLDPMKGEPYVWGQLTDDTLTVYSLFVDPVGGYVMQQYDRTLTEGGLALEFNSVRNGEKQRTVSAFLKRE